MFLIRKITRAKWDGMRNVQRGLAKGEISADAVTVDLRTRQDTLSFWRCPTAKNSDIEDTALAIAAAGGQLDKLDIVWLRDNEVQTDGYTLQNTHGRTPVGDLAERHVDICRLDYSRLGKIARRIVAAIENNQCCRLKKARIKELLVVAIEQGRIAPDQLKESLRSDIGQ